MMIDFESRNHSCVTSYPYSSEFLERKAKIQAVLKREVAIRLEVGYELLELWHSKSYCVAGAGDSNNLSARCFFRFLDEVFDIPRSTAQRLINVVDEFCTESPPKVDERWKDYTYSALIEMLPLTPSQREAIPSHWPVRRVREYVKRVLSEDQADWPDVGPLVDDDPADTDFPADLADPGEGTPVRDDIRLHPSYKYYLQRDKEFLATRIVTLEIEQRELIRIINDNGIIVDPV